jgi:hypothetical protein
MLFVWGDPANQLRPQLSDTSPSVEEIHRDNFFFPLPDFFGRLRSPLATIARR